MRNLPFVLMNPIFTLVALLCLATTASAQTLASQKFFGGDLWVHAVRHPSSVTVDSGYAPAEYRLNFHLKEGKGFRIHLVSGSFSADITEIPTKNGKEFDLVFVPQPKEDLVVLVQNDQGKWRMKIIPADTFIERGVKNTTWDEIKKVISTKGHIVK